MKAECLPMSSLPHMSRLYLDYLGLRDRLDPAAPMPTPSLTPAKADRLESWYPTASSDVIASTQPGALADLLARQSREFGAGAQTLANIEQLRNGARAIVTGQQTGLFGGPLLTLLKAASAIARAKKATVASGVVHVPVFWLASEDHDLAEVDQVTLPTKTTSTTLHLDMTSAGRPVGGLVLGKNVDALLDQVRELTAFAPICDLLADCYAPGQTLAGAFARWMTRLFAEHGLIVMDAAERGFHQLGAPVLRAAIEDAAGIEAALLARTDELERAGYQAQVLVKPGASTLFLLDAESGERQSLRRQGETWKAGGRSYTSAALLGILDSTPERLSPNALLRPLFQDAILPTAAYIGGPAEIAYFAQAESIYERVLGRVTPVLPRFSATLIEPKLAELMRRHELTLADVFAAGTAEQLALRLGARALPIEGKRRFAAAGNTLDAELTALTSYMEAMDASLGRSAAVSASKMRYQMNRLRQMAARFEMQKETSLRRHADALMLQLFPDGHPQERVLAGVWFLAQGGTGLVDTLVEHAATSCPGHCVLEI